MKELKKLSLKKEIDKEAEKIEEEVRNNKEIEDMKVSDDMETSLFNRIQEYEYDKRIKTVYRRKKKRFVLVTLAAVLVLVFGSMTTGVGSKPYWRVLWDRIVGDEKASVINIEDMDIRETKDFNEIDAYKEITRAFGISAVRLRERPQNMYLERYTIDEGQRYAILFYNYDDEMIKYSVYLNDSDSSFVQKEPDKLIDNYKIENQSVIINVDEYLVEGKEENRYIAEFEYKDVNYQLKGIMDEDEFKEIIENLKFL